MAVLPPLDPPVYMQIFGCKAVIATLSDVIPSVQHMQWQVETPGDSVSFYHPVTLSGPWQGQLTDPYLVSRFMQ